jgi:RNA polymerase sigma-70 factor (sigma-E family)
MHMSEQVAFAEYVALRRDTWLRAACLLTGDPHTAEDLVQTALLRVWPRWQRISAMQDVDAYVRKVLMNVFLTSLRRRRWREISADPQAYEPTDRHFAATPSDLVDERMHLRHVLADLPPRQRAVLVLRYYLDLSEADTATTLGCSVGTVKSQASKATTRLRGRVDAATSSVVIPAESTKESR